MVLLFVGHVLFNETLIHSGCFDVKLDLITGEKLGCFDFKLELIPDFTDNIFQTINQKYNNFSKYVCMFKC